MNSLTDPPFRHARTERTAILLLNLGTPDAPESADVRRYLREFLSDPRVVEIPKLPWRLLLETVVLPFRSPRSAAKYRSVWMTEGSPLKVYTDRQAKLLRGRLGAAPNHVLVAYGMRYGNPSIASALEHFRRQDVTRLLILPLYPQYSATTTGTGLDAVFSWFQRTRDIPEIRTVKHYHDHPAYIAALAARVRASRSAEQLADGFSAIRPRMTVMSFHGLPKRSLALGDPYHCECLKTGRLLAEELGLKADEYRVTFQSRFGKAEWLQPYTEPTLIELARSGVKAVDVFCPGFPADCLETLEEIAMEGKAAFLQAGGEDFHYIAAMNDDPVWIEALAHIAAEHMVGWLERQDTPEELQQREARAKRLGATQ